MFQSFFKRSLQKNWKILKKCFFGTNMTVGVLNVQQLRHPSLQDLGVDASIIYSIIFHSVSERRIGVFSQCQKRHL